MKSIILFLFSLLMLTACTDDFLKENAKASITSENYFKTSGDAIGSLNGVYKTLANPQMLGGTDIMMVALADLGSDDITTGPSPTNVSQAFNEISLHTYTPENTVFLDVWTNLYRGIDRANLVIEKVPEISMDKTLQNRILGEATYLRALYYFYLVRLWGDVPLLIEYTKELQTRPTRMPVAQVYAQIEKDLLFAETNISVLRYTGNDIGRVSLPTVKATLARVYLTQGKWNLASTKAQEVINTAGYSLWAKYADALKFPANENGRESLFEVQLFRDGGITSRLMIRTQPRINRIGTTPGYGDWASTDDLFKVYENADARKAFNFQISENVPYLIKHRDEAAIDRNQSNNFPIFRLSEMYLILSEALNEAEGPTTAAYTAINVIRTRSTLPNAKIGLSKDQFREVVLNERRLELALEGHRWFDLVRTNRLVAVVKSAKPNSSIADRNKLYPIPQVERDLNPNLTQNAGY